jgi:hypothetical protein
MKGVVFSQGVAYWLLWITIAAIVGVGITGTTFLSSRTVFVLFRVCEFSIDSVV